MPRIRHPHNRAGQKRRLAFLPELPACATHVQHTGGEQAPRAGGEANVGRPVDLRITRAGRTRGRSAHNSGWMRQRTVRPRGTARIWLRRSRMSLSYAHSRPRIARFGQRYARLPRNVNEREPHLSLHGRSTVTAREVSCERGRVHSWNGRHPVRHLFSEA
jgi:hypothetical protein